MYAATTLLSRTMKGMFSYYCLYFYFCIVSSYLLWQCMLHMFSHANKAHLILIERDLKASLMGTTPKKRLNSTAVPSVFPWSGAAAEPIYRGALAKRRHAEVKYHNDCIMPRCFNYTCMPTSNFVAIERERKK